MEICMYTKYTEAVHYFIYTISNCITNKVIYLCVSDASVEPLPVSYFIRINKQGKGSNIILFNINKVQSVINNFYSKTIFIIQNNKPVH